MFATEAGGGDGGGVCTGGVKCTLLEHCMTENQQVTLLLCIAW